MRDVIPYLQRFLCSHEEFAELYVELQEGGIAQQIKALSFGQVRPCLLQTCSLYIQLCDALLGEMQLSAQRGPLAVSSVCVLKKMLFSICQTYLL